MDGQNDGLIGRMMHEWMDGQNDGLMGRTMHDRMDRQNNGMGWTDRWIVHRCIDGWIDGWAERCLNEIDG